MSDFQEMAEDDSQREYEETMREPEWVRDMLCIPWVTQIDRGGTISIMDKDGIAVCTLKGRHPEMMALMAAVICEHVNKV